MTKIEHLCVVYSYIDANNNKDGNYYYVFTATMVRERVTV